MLETSPFNRTPPCAPLAPPSVSELTGHSNEAATGHWGALHRYLDPRAGRWTQRDPLEDVDGQNRYSYVADKSAASVDPTGLKVYLDQPSMIPYIQSNPVYQDLENNCNVLASVHVENKALLGLTGNMANDLRPWPEAVRIIQSSDGTKEKGSPPSLTFGFTYGVNKIPSRGAVGGFTYKSLSDVYLGSDIALVQLGEAQRNFSAFRQPPPGLGAEVIRQRVRLGIAKNRQALAGTILHELTHVWLTVTNGASTESQDELTPALVQLNYYLGQ